MKEELRSKIISTRWYTAYKSQVRQAVREACLKKNPVWLACIDGGPISEVEQMEMPQIVEEIKEENQPFVGPSKPGHEKRYASP